MSENKIKSYDRKMYDLKTNKLFFYCRQYVMHRSRTVFDFEPEMHYCKLRRNNKVYIMTFDTNKDYYDFVVIDNNAIYFNFVSPVYHNIYDFINALDYHIKYGKEWISECKHNIFNNKNEFINCIIKVKQAASGLNKYKLVRVL